MSCQLYDMQICYKLQICCHNVLFNTHTTQSLCFLCNKINKSGMPFSQNHLKNFSLYHYLYHSHDNGIIFTFLFLWVNLLSFCSFVLICMFLFLFYLILLGTRVLTSLSGDLNGGQK